MRQSKGAVAGHFIRRFRAVGSPARAVGEKAYMKSELRFHGISAAVLRAECRAFCEHHDLDAASLRAAVSELFATEWFDLRSAGIALLERRHALLGAKDAPWLIGLVRASACWAHVDYLATKVVDPVVAANLSLLRRLRVWAKDPDFWVRRTALLAQLRALRRGGGDFVLFAEIAAPMLEEKEFFIRKAIGWVLREVSKKRPALVFDFIREHGARASGLTRREAMKYLPPVMKLRLA
jgi:3-methyladenine DNA glycosylase AlkD